MFSTSQYDRNGFTLIELIIVIAIVGTVALFASSAASAAINASRTSNSVSNLFAALTRARSFAATSAVDVVLCPSSDGIACASGYRWEGGWIAFVASHAGSDRTADEPILLRQAALPSKVHLITSAGRTRVRFQPSGGNAGSNVTFTFCDGRGAGSASAYAMANSGTLHSVPTEIAYVAQACAGR
ncbi:MAG TPA: GspH/FimT family pseudopilin [Rudaea sp.]|jgi:type IV fimbrial biogenesis protein FimT